MFPPGLPREEVKAFRRECAARNRRAEDFSLEVLDSVFTTDSAETRLVTVRRDGISRCYQSGFGMNWVGRFVEDLRMGRWR